MFLIWFWIESQSNYAVKQNQIVIRVDWNENGMIWFDLERNNAKRKSNQILIICKVMNAFCWPNPVYYIYRTIPKHKNKDWPREAAKTSCHFLPKSLKMNYILESSSRRFKDCNTFLDTSRSFSNPCLALKHQESRSIYITVWHYFWFWFWLYTHD